MGKPLSAVKRWSDERKWEDDIDWVDFKDGDQILLRVVGDVTVMARHWLTTSKSNKRFPQWCPQLDANSEDFIPSRPCPAHDDFQDNLKAQKVLIGTCIVRSVQERGDDNPVRGFMIPHACNDDLKDIVEMIKADPADPEKGVDLAIRYNSKAKGNKKWGIQRGDNTPLTAEEKKYQYYDFDALAPDFDDKEVAEKYAKAMKEAMGRNRYYLIQTERVPDGARDPFKYFKGDAKGKPWNSFKELVDFKNEQAGEDAATHKVATTADDDGKEEVISDDSGAPSKPDDDVPPPPKEEKEPEPEKKKKPAKDADVKDLDPNVHPDDSIGTKDHASLGKVPECFAKYDGDSKCHRCPVRAKCIDDTDDDDDL